MPKIAQHFKLPKLGWKKEDVGEDVGAAVVLGVESVPDGLASGILAGVNPVAGLYAYMFGVASAAMFTSTAFMAVQGTGAMAIIVNDVDLASTDDPARSLVTLGILTGVIMMLAGALKAGVLLRFVSHSVMTGFISAVGLNIVLGQLGDITAYDSNSSNRVTRAIDTIFHPWRIDVWTLSVGIATIILIIGLRRTRLGAMGMVVAIVLGSAVGNFIQAFDRDIELVGNVADVPNRLPAPLLPAFGEVFFLIIPALSLAFVGLVQGAGVSSAFANPDEPPGDTDQDFIAQGVGNLVAGGFQGTPVGGSMSASSLATSAGAKSRWALVYTFAVMAAVILLFAGVVEYIAMPALAGLLIVVGFETIKPHDILSVYKTGSVQMAVMLVTFGLTLLIPLQFAVLVGVGMSMILYVVRQSNQLDTRRLILADDGGIDEVDPPETVAAHEVVVLQPYGSLFFAAAPTLEEQMPTVTDASSSSVVILRLRGKPDVGSTLIDVLVGYSEALAAEGSKLMIVTDNERIIDQLDRTGALDMIGEANVYRGTTRMFGTLTKALHDAEDWVAAQVDADGATTDEQSHREAADAGSQSTAAEDAGEEPRTEESEESDEN
ncbi:MAG: SulP family inorganic anion transporter [Acidimicrobiales bacterium]